MGCERSRSVIQSILVDFITSIDSFQVEKLILAANLFMMFDFQKIFISSAVGCETGVDFGGHEGQSHHAARYQFTTVN